MPHTGHSSHPALACTQAVPWRCRVLQAAALTAGLLAAGAAAAHDSWFAPLPPTPRGEAVFALGTGNRFPLHEFPIPKAQLRSSGCRGVGLQAAPMRWMADAPAAVVLRSATPVPASGAMTCWAQLHPLDIEIDDAIVEIYLKEINALPAVRERWAALRAAGVRWQETYTKYARVELHTQSTAAVQAGVGAAASEAAAGAPVAGLGMDIRIDSPQPLRAGDLLRAQVLRDGQPLAGLPVELRSDLSPLGAWRTTDAQGWLQLPVPLAARWLLRAVDLRAAPGQPERWDSRFVTLAFEVLPKR